MVDFAFSEELLSELSVVYSSSWDNILVFNSEAKLLLTSPFSSLSNSKGLLLNSFIF